MGSNGVILSVSYKGAIAKHLHKYQNSPIAESLELTEPQPFPIESSVQQGFYPICKSSKNFKERNIQPLAFSYSIFQVLEVHIFDQEPR